MIAKTSITLFGKVALLTAITCVSWQASRTSASPITPSFDLFTSNDLLGDSLGAAVDLSGFGLGVVDLKGAPFAFGGFDPSVGIDTVVERLQGIDPFDPPGGSGVIDIELVALHLVSVAPIDLTPLGGPFIGVNADLHTTINKGGIIAGLPQPDVLPPSLGKMEIRHELGPLSTEDIGGTFDSIFGSPGDAGVPAALLGLLVVDGGVTADAILTVVGGDPADPTNVLFSAPAPRVTIWSQGSTWKHTPFTDFQVTSIEHNCSFPECHPVEPIFFVPEPSTLALLALSGLLFAKWRQQTQ